MAMASVSDANRIAHEDAMFRKVAVRLRGESEAAKQQLRTLSLGLIQIFSEAGVATAQGEEVVVLDSDDEEMDDGVC